MLNFKSQTVQWVWLILLIATPIVLWILPANFFDESKVILCPSRLFFDIECLGCGMTRAVMHIHHFEFEDAVFYNIGSIAIYPALIGVWGLWIYKAGRILSLWPEIKKIAKKEKSS